MKPYYQDEASRITIYHGDCREVLPGLPLADLLLTDPPYELTASGGGIGAKRDYLSSIDGHIDCGFDVSLLASFPNWCVFCAKAQLPLLLDVVGGRRWCLVTWNKPNPTPLVNCNYLPDTEYVVHAYQPGRLFGEYKDRSRFIVLPVERNNFGHPTVKPLAVVNKMMRLGSECGDLVVDPFCGSGTTLVSARDCGRRAIGIEIEERYCEIAAKRLSQGVLQF
jgi:DNA modification methylase